MSQSSNHQVLRVRVVVDDAVVDEVHQTRAGSVSVGRKLRSGIVVFDDHAPRRDTRKLAPVWLVVGVVLVLAGVVLFASSLHQYALEKAELDAQLAAMGGQGVDAFKPRESGPLSWIGVLLIVVGLVPLMASVVSFTEPKTDRSGPSASGKGRAAPDLVELFHYANGVYTLDVPAGIKGKISLGKKAMTLGALRKRFGQGERLRLDLNPRAKGKLLLGETTVMFQFTAPAAPPPRAPLPPGVFSPIGLLAVGPLAAACYGVAFLLFGPLFFYFGFIAEPVEVAASKRMQEFTGVVAYQQEEKEEVVDEDPEEEENLLEQEDDEEVEPDEEVEKVDPDRIVAVKPTKYSKEAEAKARGVGVARVLGTYGGPGEGTVYDVIQGTENNLGDLFDKGMTTTVMSDGGPISPFVAGGEGISASGAAVQTQGLKTTDDQPELEQSDKKEKKIKGKLSGSTGDIVGDLDKTAVKATIKRRMGALRTCYEKQLRTDPNLKGKMSFTITISTVGKVTKVVVESDSLNNAAAATCMTAKIKGWRFPTEGAEEPGEVSFSVVFSGAS